MIGEVGRCDRVASRSRNRDRRHVSSLTGCGMGRNRRPLRDAGLDLATNPRPTDLDRQSRPTIRTVKLEERQQVFRAIRGPRREEAMLSKSQWPATMGCHEPLVTHQCPPPTNDTLHLPGRLQET
jgi:hypothetical protein